GETPPQNHVKPPESNRAFFPTDDSVRLCVAAMVPESNGGAPAQAPVKGSATPPAPDWRRTRRALAAARSTRTRRRARRVAPAPPAPPCRAAVRRGGWGGPS